MSGCNSQQKIVSCFWYLFSSHLTPFAQKKGEPMKQNKTYLHLGVTLIVSAFRADVNLGKVDFEVAPETK